MNILLNNEKYRLDIFELSRIFLPSNYINFTSNINDKDDNLIVDIDRDIRIEFIPLKGDKKIKVFEYEDIDNLEYREVKQMVKRYVLELYQNYYNKKAPWGILTGIRPVKIVNDMIDDNKSYSEIDEILRDRYKLSENKRKLILDIGFLQKDIMFPIDYDKFNLYINIPFCPTRCEYCSFPTVVLREGKDYRNSYVEMVIRELKGIASSLKNKKLNTIYFGGGTPTTLRLTDLEKIIKTIYDLFGTDFKEFTMEAGREDTIDYKMLKGLKDLGVTRISLNPQTMKDETLKLIGRCQDNNALIKKYHMARDIGFDSINMDIILGLPRENLFDVQNTLEKINKLSPDNLTVHTLAVKRGSKFLDKNIDLSRENTLISDMVDFTYEFTKKYNYEAYYLYRQKQMLGNFENIGYAKDKKYCIYNMAIMEETQSIIGVGMTSNSKILYKDGSMAQFRNYKNLKDYYENIDSLIEEKNKIIMKG